MTRPVPEPVPRLWPGEKVLLVGSGCSLQFDDVKACRDAGYRILACNDNYVLNPDLLYVADRPWLAKNLEANSHPLKWTPSKAIAEQYPGAGWHWVRIDNHTFDGMSFDPGILAHGSNSGFQMLNLAVLLGVARVLLTGYDLAWGPGRRPRWKGEHPQGVESADKGKFSGWIENFRKAAPGLAQAGVSVINVSRETDLDAFPVVALERILEGERNADQAGRRAT